MENGEYVDMEKLKEEIDKEEDIGKIASYLKSISSKDKEARKQLVNSIDLMALKEKIDKADNVYDISYCFSMLDIADKGTEEKLIEIIDFEKMKEKLVRSNDLFIVSEIITNIIEDRLEIGDKSVEILASKIDESKSIENIEMCLNDMIATSEEIGRRLVKSINLEKLKTTINKSIDKSDFFTFSEICWLFSHIAGADRESAERLIESVDLQRLIKRIDKEEMIKEIGWWIVHVAEADMETGLKILKSIKKSREVKECMISSLIPKAEKFKNISSREILDVLTGQ
jgi:hypothetical protein